MFTHDFIVVGEDGPTHQPVEHLASLRAIPGLIILRPADAAEVLEAWKVIMQFRHEPVALILTRQAVPTLDRTKYASAEGLGRALTSSPTGRTATPTSCCSPRAARSPSVWNPADGIKTRVVSIPSGEMFEYHSAKILSTVTASYL